MVQDARRTKMTQTKRISIPAPETLTVEMLTEAAHSKGSAHATLMLGLWATKIGVHNCGELYIELDRVYWAERRFTDPSDWRLIEPGDEDYFEDMDSPEAVAYRETKRLKEKAEREARMAAWKKKEDDMAEAVVGQLLKKNASPSLTTAEQAIYDLGLELGGTAHQIARAILQARSI
jgi:hypothetical protein